MAQPDTHSAPALATASTAARTRARVAPARTEVFDAPPRVRHRHQLELKLRYALPAERRKTVYDLSVYFFLPPSLGVDPVNYTKKHFYADLQSHIRLKTPEVSLPEITLGGSGPFFRLSAAALRLEADSSKRSVRLHEYQTKLFCCVLKSALRSHLDRVASTTDPDDRIRRLETFRLSTTSLRSAYGELGRRLSVPVMPPQVMTVYRFADEYISVLLEENTYRAITLVPNDPAAERLRERLVAFAGSEFAYRGSQGYPSVPSRDGDNEGFVYRRGVLKKYMSDVLLLSARVGRGAHWLRESVFGFAAAVSMIFATAVLFVSTRLWGTLTMPVFLALVVSYIFKDRIKELLRVYLSRKAARWFFDHRTRLYTNPKDEIGVCRESVDFIEADMVPAPVTAVRNRSHITEIEGGWIGEHVIRYRKHVTLWPARIADIYGESQVRAVNDIVRFNVREFVRHLGTVDRPVHMLDGADVRDVRGERVHHLNLIVRYDAGGPDMAHRYRIVLNRNGIKRVESVAGEGVEEGRAPRPEPTLAIGAGDVAD